MSNRMTFSLASFILLIAFGLVFGTTSVLAHQTIPDDTFTFDQHHDGKLNATPTLDDPTETNHTHLDAPSVSTPELVDLMVGTGADAMSSVRAMEVRLVDNAGTPTAFTDVVGSGGTAPTAAGQFQVKITFSEPVFATAAADATAADTDLVAADLTVTAASQAAPGVNLFGAGVTVSTVARAADDTETADVDESAYTFLVTLELAATLFGNQTATAPVPTQLPIDVYITVNKDSLYISDGRLVDGDSTFGRGNSASMKAKVTVVPSFSNNAPTVTISTDAPTTPVDTGSFEVMYTTMDLDSDTVTVTPSLDAAAMTAGYTVMDSIPGGTVTITQPTADASNPSVDAATVTLTLTPNDGTVDGTAATLMVDFAAQMYEADTTGPTATDFDAESPVDTSDGLTFTITFDEALGTGFNGLDLDDLTITGGDPVASTDAMPNPTSSDRMTWMVEVTPDSADMPQVTVSFSTGAQIADAAGNALDIEGSEGHTSASVDEVAPTATGDSAEEITHTPAAPSGGAYVAFTFTFDEDIDIKSVTANSLSQSIPSHNVVINSNYLNPRHAQDADDMDMMDTVIVTVRSVDITKPTLITLATGQYAVKDMAGNTLAETYAASYSRSGPDAGVPDPTISGPDTLSCMPDTPMRNLITVTFDEVLKAGEKLAVGDIMLTGKGWAITAGTADNTFNLTPMADRSWIGTTQVTFKVKADVVVDADNKGNTAKERKFTVGPVLTIPGTDTVPGGGYLVVVRSEAEARTHLRQVPTLHVGDPHVGAATVMVDTWDCMPDLGTLLGRTNFDYDRGGRLIVKGGGGLIVKQSADHVAKAGVANSGTIGGGTVGVSEIMWAIDRSQLFGAPRNFSHAQEQWIELHNLNPFPVKVTLFDLETTETYPGNNYGTEIDRVSNFNAPPHGGSWPIRNANRGQDGDSDYGEDFVAMQRGPANLGKNYLHGDFNGRNGGKWSKATAVYLTKRARLATTGQLDPNNLNYDFIGTPGVRNNIGPDAVAGVTGVPLKPFIFNEIGNRSNRIYDWIELRNTSGGRDNLRNHQISIVRGVNNEEILFTFPNSDIWLENNELILILATDPEDDGEHPIAVGHDVLGGTDQAPGLGPNPAKYIVASRSERLYTEGLPNGNFVLVLRRSEADDKRNAHGKLKTPDWILDLAGWDNDLGDRNAGPKFTALWPLNGHGAPFSKNNLTEGKVWFRRDPGRLHGENNNDKPAFVSVGYTGVGYRRHAQNVPEHGGTPGYHDIRKNQAPSGEAAHKLTGGTVTISEIMFDTGDGRHPQWIELYNSSATNAVNLRADAGWRLVIDNYDDKEIPLARISGTLNFKDSEVQTILPQQTVLVTSTRARSAGSDTTNASIVFIPTRVFSVWSEKPAREAFGMGRSTDPILSERAFHIELMDGKGNTVDEVGNLIQARGRIVDQVAWEWSDINAAPMEDGPRSSVIRRYREPAMGDSRDWERYTDEEIMEMGVMAEGWVAAHETDFRNVRGSWYGDRDDIGSPGVTGGRVLPVELSKFRPERLEDGSVMVRWITESEKDNAGFNILRSETRDGEFTKLNTQLIAGQGTTSERNLYEFTDKSAKPNVVYYYQIQDVSLDGDVQMLQITHLRGHISAVGKAATTWGELKALQ